MRMRLRLKNLVAGGLLFIAGPAWAGESLVNGQPLQYNYEYHCNGERIVVGHCYDNDDNSYCQDYYPDRPYHNGFMIQPVEKRGDVIAKLNACVQTASAQTTSTATGGSGSGHNGVHVASSRSPGLGSGTWQLLEFDKNSAFYFTKTKLTRSGTSAQGWFTDVLSSPKDFAQLGVSGVQFMQILYWADCTNDTYAIREVAWYDANRQLIPASTQMDASPTFKQAGHGTRVEHLVNVLCGKPQSLSDKGPLSGDGDFLVADYLERLNHPESVANSNSAHSASGSPAGSKAGPAHSATAASKPPGLGNGNWYPLTQGDGAAEFFTVAGVKRTGKRPSSWFTDAYLESPSDLPGVIFVQALVEADCANSSTRVLQVDEYDKNKKRVTEEGPYQSFEQAAPNTFASDRVAFLCGKKPIKDYGPPVFGGGEDLIEWYQIVLEVQKQEAAAQKQ